jgi:hypothetical protein
MTLREILAQLRAWDENHNYIDSEAEDTVKRAIARLAWAGGIESALGARDVL